MLKVDSGSRVLTGMVTFRLLFGRLENQRPAEFVFSDHVGEKLAEIRASNPRAKKVVATSEVAGSSITRLSWRAINGCAGKNATLD